MSGPSYETKWMLTDQSYNSDQCYIKYGINTEEIERNRYFKIFSMEDLVIYLYCIMFPLSVLLNIDNMCVE